MKETVQISNFLELRWKRKEPRKTVKVHNAHVQLQIFHGAPVFNLHIN